MRCALLIGLATLLIAQEQPRFEVRSPLVVVPVSVTDAKGNFVSDLSASDFLVFDNGRAQKATVDTIDTGVAPIALVLRSNPRASPRRYRKVQRIGGHDPADGHR